MLAWCAICTVGGPRHSYMKKTSLKQKMATYKRFFFYNFMVPAHDAKYTTSIIRMISDAQKQQ